MKQPNVSIITPSYNRGHLIEDTIKSVISQSYKNIEYIIVDGESTDNTLEILEKYKKKSQLYYVSEKDSGMYYAINKGINMAQGDIIAYLNSDDRYFPWTVQTAVEAFQNNDGIDMIYGDSFVVDTLTKKNRLNIYASHKKYWLPTGGIICQPTVFLRKNVFEKAGFFNTEFRYLADCEFWLRVNKIMADRIIKIDEVLAAEYNHPGTIRHTFQEGIKIEKEKLMLLYGKEYFWRKIRLFILRLYIERKLWKFIIINLTNHIIPYKSWRNFLSAYNANFNLFYYFLRKLYHLPSYVKRVRKGERMF
ncbi:glycosyltransferase [candidate division WS5 bacterium]|uniref:Glycosyltransferase n=1 Tax=candidate division WS5 bacterium TaxID=2093353 RepID=A0A419DGA3_9BACT|nr:MAG: glycosyltransferase [candidate division WS5 bacterium]